MGRDGKRRGEGKGQKGKGWRREGGKVKEEMGGTGEDMGWNGGRERRKGREREERGYSPQTSIPGAATGRLFITASEGGAGG